MLPDNAYPRNIYDGGMRFVPSCIKECVRSKFIRGIHCRIRCYSTLVAGIPCLAFKNAKKEKSGII